MPLLERDDPLPAQVNRIVVAVACGAGKSTVAAAIASELGFPYVELDALYHGPGWIPRPSFDSDVARFAESERWVTEWQYTGSTRPRDPSLQRAGGFLFSFSSRGHRRFQGFEQVRCRSWGSDVDFEADNGRFLAWRS